MDDKDFRKHLRDLAHGHHHPEEHDWSTGSPGATRAPAKSKAAKAAKPAKKKSK